MLESLSSFLEMASLKAFLSTFSKIFYIALIKSLNDMLHLYDLLSEETSNISNNKSKMPVSGYGTREIPGHIVLWLISLGSQKEAIQQWLGKDDLTKYKSMEPTVKFIRAKLMEARAHSEARQDLDSKLTLIRYEDIRHTQGENHTRQQISLPYKQHSSQHQRPSFSAIQLEPDSSYSDNVKLIQMKTKKILTTSKSMKILQSTLKTTNLILYHNAP